MIRVLYGESPRFMARLWQTGNVFSPKGWGVVAGYGVVKRRYGEMVARVGWGVVNGWARVGFCFSFTTEDTEFFRGR